MQESERIFIAENATLLRGSERELNRQLFTILNSIYDGLYITDGQANTILINRAYEEVSGLRREDVLGKSMQEIVATGMIDRSGSLGGAQDPKAGDAGADLPHRQTGAHHQHPPL